ncbi:GntR family transcriptional regulator [Streptacidiphilus sp. N1-10]|uniref:GntR family transcriptional regulator n=1 Tax=Streptacidiphilus jeojiensis TaxID=3229225 RepID=A0ABV6XXY6_9ACTN
MARRGTAVTLNEDIYRRIRGDILAGRLHPGDKLSPAELRERFGVSLGVIREALTKLTEQKLVSARSGQGFNVVTLSPEELGDLTLVRIDLEARALRLAIERGDLSWEGEVVSAHHRLARTPMRDADDPERTGEEWAAAHAAFHEALISACQVPLLLDFCHTLRAATELYRRWSGPAAARLSAKRDVGGEHLAIMEATVARDADLAAELLAEHFRRTQQVLLAGGFTQPQTLRQAPSRERD